MFVSEIGAANTFFQAADVRNSQRLSRLFRNPVPKRPGWIDTSNRAAVKTGDGRV